MAEYLNIEQGLLLGAYKAGLSFRELIDLIAVSQGGEGGKSVVDNPRASQSHTLLADYTLVTPYHIAPHSIPSSVIKRYLMNNSSTLLLGMCAACLWWDKKHDDEYWEWLESTVGVSKLEAHDAAYKAKRIGLIRMMRSRPDIGRYYAKKYSRGAKGG